ncbi:autotransporter outer membrane beta-barrel domain-containing protein [Candidatus Rhabdochlamydia porcellionis]|uniref:Autotransporter beta-domain n=1 Tax=Candidatus Rhabdochlamydia porcellionis TaxID=225148 RepID=A0ABX8YZZ9_9BACT|nr:autotransporter outer membrane beta-barrel domain-containing protein [Candidatus Rhabdochlamydia porcellionis]QZA58610.1 Autotransporter beta-domain [Candidatus Rhabdochlamydia porcellionis]
MRIIMAITLSSLSFAPLWADNFQVTNSQDAGVGSLRQAITDFNAASGTNTIIFNSGIGNILLGSDLPLITRQGTIVVPSGTSLDIDGTAGPYRIFGASGVANISIQVPSTSGLNLLGLMDGSGTLIGSGGGILDLRGSNTYTGGTIINSGLILALIGTGTLDPASGVVVNSSTFNIANITAPVQTIAALSGSGNALVELGSKNLIVNQTISTTYPGVIDGIGSFTKQGSGILTLTGDSSGFSSGAVNIDAGTLLVNGRLEGTFTIDNNAIFGGAGTAIGNVTNNGSVQPGNSIGTLTINGNYTQNASGELVIEINEAGATDLLVVTGAATLNGVLQVSPEPGLYLEGTTYTFLTAGSVTGQFSSTFSTRPLNYAINYFPSQVQLLIPSNFFVTPPRPSGNAGAVVGYLFCPSFDFTNTDLVTVTEALLELPANQYAEALNRLTPSQFGAFALNELENNFSMANSFFVTEANQRACYYPCESTHIWINPLGLVYSQKSRLQLGQEAVGFTNHTYGVTAGVDHLFSNDWKLGFGLGYSYSHLHWKNQAGKARADSGYLGPYIGYYCGSFYFDFLVLGAGNFYDVDRKIAFPGISRVASSHPTTWDLSEVMLLGFRLEPLYNFFVQPEFLLDQLNVFQESFQESGANSIDLAVKRKYTSFLRSLINLKFTKEWLMCNMCLAPSVNVGWLRTTPLTGRHYTAKFRKGTFCEPNFSVTSFSEVVDQILVSGQFLLSSQGGFSMSLGYDGRFGYGSKINEVNLALDWSF